MKLMDFETLHKLVSRFGFSFELAQDGGIDVWWTGRGVTMDRFDKSPMWKLIKCHKKVINNHYGVSK